MSILAATYRLPCYSLGDVFVLDWGSTLAKSLRPLADVFVENLNSYLRKHGDQKKLADAIGVSKTTITNWKTGVTQPSFEDVHKLAEFFGTWPHMLFLDRSGVDEVDEAAEPTVEDEVRRLRAMSVSFTRVLDDITDRLNEKEKTLAKVTKRKA